ncbi:MAG TPA: pirin family protein [Polyangia bacterium]|nr:pirin family protein [Polyangia bacterium]
MLSPRERDLGGFTVRRLLPATGHRMVGPFIFFDYIGPAAMAPGQGVDVRPHPHINLATVTYLFEGELVHRDSLGYQQAIRPGDVNWMTAGRGIVHSERSDPSQRVTGVRLHGLQLWVALPTAHEETAPAFVHYGAAVLPLVETPGARCRVIAGEAWGARSPVRTLSPLVYAELKLAAGASSDLPDQHEQRALFVMGGSVDVAGVRVDAGQMALLAPEQRASVRGIDAAHAVLIGGAPLDGERHIWWNFVSSSRERIEKAKLDWKEGRFPKVPGDDVEFVPLPDH